MGVIVILHLGVLDPMIEPNGNTAFEVGTILEDKYGLFSNFYYLHKGDIADAIADSLQGAIDMIANGEAPKGDIFADANAQISTMMNHFLRDSEVEGLGIPGVPTKAALEGHSKRRRAGGKARKVLGSWKSVKGARRPSFIDSGILQTSLRAWID